MTRTAPVLIVLLLAAAALPGAAAAQFTAAQPARYLQTTDVADGRAVWLQPAGLSRRREASVGLHAGFDRTAGDVTLAEYGLTFASSGLALGWQHDNRPGDTDGSAYGLGLGLGEGRVGAGFARRWYRQQGKVSSTFDVGLRYQPSRLLDLSVVLRDIGDPVVRDTVQKSVLVPGAAISLLGGRLRASGEVDIVTDGWGSSETRFGATFVVGAALAVRVRSAFGPGLSGRELAVALEWATPRGRITTFGTDRRAGNIQHAGMAGALVAVPPGRRGRR